jgi:O-antigen ligase
MGLAAKQMDRWLGGGISSASERALFTLRNLKLLLVWLLMWQGAMVHGSIFQLEAYLPSVPSIREEELVLLASLAVLFIERILLGDLTLRRSYFWAPMLVLLSALIISWARGAWINQQIGFVYEVHESILTPATFFLIINSFREKEDHWALMTLLLFATLAKAIDGAYIKFFSHDMSKTWGIVQLWRDGFLLAAGISGLLLLLHYRGTRFVWLRRLMLIGSPILFFTFILSYRRTFFIAAFVSAGIMLLTIGRGRRKRHLWLMVILVVVVALSILLTEPTGFLLRLFGILEPGQEGSAYIRLMEYPNVLRNIRDNPIWGTAIGTQWHQYYRMPLFAVYTTLGTHNTYLYWQLRTGILGSFGFFWLLARAWKALVINVRIAKTEEQFFVSQFSLHLLIIYMVGCAFGIMYADVMCILFPIILTMYQLQMIDITGLNSYRDVDLIKTYKAKAIVLRAKSKVLATAAARSTA